MRAPVSRSRPPCSAGPLAGRRRCACRRARPGGRGRVRRRASPTLVDPDARAVLPARGAGGELEAAQLLGGQRGLAVGVVLAAGRACTRTGRRACARRRRSRSGGRGARGRADRRRAAARAGGRRSSGLDQRVAAGGGALLGDPAVRGGRVAGLADLRVQAEVGDQLAAVGEAADVADGGHEGRGDDQVHAGDGHQPARPAGQFERLRRDHPLDLGDLAVEEVDLAQPGVDGLALLDRQLQLGQPRPALDCRTGRSPAGGPSGAGSGPRGSRS